MNLERSDFKNIQSRWFQPLQMLELDACSRCQECVTTCPVVRAGYQDSAMERITDWRRINSCSNGILSKIFRIPSSEPDLPALFGSLFRCTTCGACSVVCESGISTTSLWESMRGAGREMGFIDDAIEKTAIAIDMEKNPYNACRKNRADWIPDDIHISHSAPVAFFAGCTIAFRQPELGRAALRILRQTDTDFCMLGNNEACCGSFLFRTGSWKEYTGTIMAMIQDFKSRGVETVIFSCAGCLKTVTLDWTRVYGRPLPFKTMSFSVFLRDCIRNNRIRFSSDLHRKVMYHDPCHGGRHLMHGFGKDEVFEAPREVLSAIPGLELTEFSKNREFQVCCGAGGGVKTGDPSLALLIAQEKLEQVSRENADILASTCPFCKRNLGDALFMAGSSVEVLDVIELVDRMMDIDYLPGNPQ